MSEQATVIGSDRKVDSPMKSKEQWFARAPISLNGERRKAMKLVYAVETDAKMFKDNWLQDATDDFKDEWMDFLNEARMRDNKIYKTAQDFGNDIARLREDEYLGDRYRTINQLERVVRRAKVFGNIIEKSRDRLRRANAIYLSKYCLSFFSELEDMDVKCVRDYENNIDSWKQEFEERLQQVHDAVVQMKEMSEQSFAEYIMYYGEILHYMLLAVDSITEACDPLKSWVVADEGYVKKIEIEMESLKRRRVEIGWILEKGQSRVEYSKSKVVRNRYNAKKVKDKLTGSITDRRYCRKRELSFGDHISMTEDIIHEKNLELEEVIQRIHKQPKQMRMEAPPAQLVEKTARLQNELIKLERKLKSMKKGKRDMREKRYNVQKDVHRLKGEYEDSLKATDRVHDFARHQEQDMRDLQEEMRVVTTKIHALRRIREVKLHPDTVKKIYFQGYTPGAKIDFRGGLSQGPVDPKDTLKEAIEVAATGVGKDWPSLYQKLPFNPPRDRVTRSTDLQVIDQNFKISHPPPDQMALRSLEKWKDMSKVTSVNALVRTLRSIKKAELAQKIEKQVLTVVN